MLSTMRSRRRDSTWNSAFRVPSRADIVLDGFSATRSSAFTLNLTKTTTSSIPLFSSCLLRSSRTQPILVCSRRSKRSCDLVTEMDSVSRTFRHDSPRTFQAHQNSFRQSRTIWSTATIPTKSTTELEEVKKELSQCARSGSSRLSLVLVNSTKPSSRNPS